MLSFSAEEEAVFFDTFDRTPEDSSPCCSAAEEELEFRKLDSEFWKKDVISIRERRKKFLFGMSLNEVASSPLGCLPETKERDYLVENTEFERITESSGYVLNSLSSSDDVRQNDLVCIRDVDSGKKFIIHEVGQDGLFSMLKEVGSNKLVSLQEFEALLGSSHSVQNFILKEGVIAMEKHSGDFSGKTKKQKSWWRRFIPNRPLGGICKNDIAVKSSKLPRNVQVKVLRHKKKCLEFTALYMGQEIHAHRGLIRTLKFNNSGCYLASGGEDCVVRIWQVRKAEALCKCSAANDSCEFVNIVKDRKLMVRRKGTDSARVVIPKMVFMIDETPLQKLHGHTSEVLDLSWSSSDCLLTSSMDKTVRLWKVDCDECLKVFQHYDYVTCVQFYPVDDKYFLSGSIDGKVRIWDVLENHVISWADIREIVTAACYHPDGEGFVVGSVMGNCCFYNYSGTVMCLETKFCIQGTKKSAGKPITGLQFSPEDPQKVMITSMDSRVRIFDGVDVIHKFRGIRKTKRQLSSSFTSDGRYIVSVGNDSNVYIWNYDPSSIQSSKEAKPLKPTRSCELFSSRGASVAVPWPGYDHGCSISGNDRSLNFSSQPLKFLEPSTWLWDSDFRSIGAWLFGDGVSKGSATWPEEKLEDSKDHMRRHRRYHRLAHLSATWSMVIVTAGYDGIIRSFHNYGLPVRL